MPQPRSQEAVDEAIRKARAELVQRIARCIAAGEIERTLELMAPGVKHRLKANGFTEEEVAEMLCDEFRQALEAELSEKLGGGS